MRQRQSSVMIDTQLPVRSIGAAARGVGGGVGGGCPPRPCGAWAAGTACPAASLDIGNNSASAIATTVRLTSTAVRLTPTAVRLKPDTTYSLLTSHFLLLTSYFSLPF